MNIDPEPGEGMMDWMARAIRTLNPADYATAALGRDRPYDGQPHTDEGTRGATLVSGLTFRDVKDCFVIGAFRASGLSPDQYPADIYGLDWASMDPLAVAQNMACAMEERMGIFPNVPPLECAECGVPWSLDHVCR